MIKKLVSHLGEYKRAAVLTPLFAALEAVMDVLLPTIMAFIIDQGIEKGDMNAILKYGLLTFLVAVVALALGVLAGKYAAEASTGFAGNLRDAMYENIQHYSFSNIDKFSTAGLVTRMTTDVTNVQNAFQMIERMCVRAPVHLVFALFMALMIGGPLSLIFVVAVVFLVAVLAGIMVPTFHIFDRVFKNYDALNASVQENVSAIRVVKSFVREGIEYTDRATGEARTFNSATLPKGTVVDGMDVGGYEFSPMFVNESRFKGADFRDIPLLANREVWLRKTVMGPDGQPELDEGGRAVKDTVKVMPAQLKEAVDAGRSRYLAERAEHARQASRAAEQEAPRAQRSVER